ncbi:MAG: PKD domain-containing protein [Gammaproteobacteria bacterium]|jgi:hypothetical protein
MTRIRPKIRVLPRGLIVALLTLVASACGGGGGGGGGSSAPAPTNRAPVADAGADQAATVGEQVTLRGSASDPDGDPVTLSWTITTRPTGSLSALSGSATASPSFTPDLGGDYVLTLTASDGSLQSTDQVMVRANTPPMAIAGPDQNVEVGATVTLDGRGSSDADDDTLTYRWSLTRPVGSQATLSDPGSATPSFVADVAGRYAASLVVNDGRSDSLADTTFVSASPAVVNTPPVADAGTDQLVEVGVQVTLDGSGSSDPDGDGLGYAWTLEVPSGSTAGLSDVSAVSPTFTPDVAGTYTATLIVNDGQENSAPDSVIVEVSPEPNSPPVADAGEAQMVEVGVQVTLSGSGSDPDGDPISFSWELEETPVGSGAVLADQFSPTPSFIADVGGVYRAFLTVSDGKLGGTATDSVEVMVNTPPVADAGPNQSVTAGSEVTLDGAASVDPDGDPLTYAWELVAPSGSNAALSDPTAVTPTFTADQAGAYTATLQVNDNRFGNSADTVQIDVVAPGGNLPPVANAGAPVEVNAGESVTLDGSGSNDPEGQLLQYLWTLTRPDGSTTPLSGATPTFLADVAGTYTASLIVSDGTDESLPDSVDIVANGQPSAAAGPDRDATTGATVELDGSASSDPDGDPISFSWVLEAPAGSGAVLADPFSASPFFVPDVGGVYIATLTVSDGKAQDVDSVQITANTPPVADAGTDQSVDVGVQVTLNGSGSSDPDGDGLSYAWALEVPSGSTAGLSDGSAASPVFTPDVEGSYLATLVVSDGRVDSAPDSVAVIATNPDVEITGRVTFDRVPHDAAGGLDYDATFAAPARGVTVEALDAGVVVIASATTDDSGNYALTVPLQTTVSLRVKAQMIRAGTPGWDFRVVDNTNADALYALVGAPFDSGTADLVVDLNARSGWDPSAQAYTSTRSAAPFAILDTVYDSLQLLLEADPDGSFPALILSWSPLNRPSATFDPDVGDIISTAYVVGFGVRGMFILGAENVDTDEYDFHVVAHEFGHYIEDRLGRTDSTGGSHTITARLDPRLAFSEGWSNAFSAMAVGDPLYRDSRGVGQAFAFGFDIESNSVANEGWYNESSVHSVLYDIFDDASDGLDATAVGFGPIYEGMTTWHAQTDAVTSLFSLIPELKNRLPADAANIDQLLAAQSIVGSSMDIWASTETNDAGQGADVLPVYTELALGPGNTATVCTISQFGDFNRLSNRRFLRFEVPVADEYQIVVTGPADSDPDLAIYRQGRRAIFNGFLAGEERAVIPLSAGTHVLEVYDSCIVDGTEINAICPNVTPARTCLNATVEPL